MNRTTTGRFVKGQSGNPAGRPKGLNGQLRDALNDHGQEVIDKIIEAAKDGDMAALKMCLDRLVPPLRPTSKPVNIDLPEDLGLAATSRHLLEAAANGKVEPDIAAQLINSLASLARITEITELDERIKQIESQLSGNAQA